MFVSAASVEHAFTGQTARLSCEVMDIIAAYWMYQQSENTARHKIYANVTMSDADYGKYTVDGSSLIINEVKASDAGIYICGHGKLVYHKLRLKVDGV